ncbi:uncharacterized protein LOC119968391 isoform X3 [Scyliorhinus canicula]|uniref:uncharacterized protein LOC119968391 isoform X3 n=1 Tax=Scyliorhinus canicula TaxID=7830 RepID=UPI0018F7106A|nr:uncharacterized protein LOC119968391 isoform X3 [Scyliorhinus canicula]
MCSCLTQNMVLQYTRSVLRRILSGVLNWWRLMLVPKLHSTGIKIDPFSYLTTAVEFPEAAPSVATRQLCASFTVPSESQHEQTDGMTLEFLSLQEESKESRKRIVRIENDIQCIRSELAKLQTEWEYRQHHLLTEWSDCTEQIWDECSEQTVERKDLEHPLKDKMRKMVIQAQHVTCRQRKDCTMKDKVDRPCSEQVAQPDFLSQFDESDQAEMISCESEPFIKQFITAMPLHSFPCGPTSLTSSVAIYSNSRPGPSVSLPYRFKPDLGSNRPLKAYAPRSILDVQIGHRVKVILPTGKIGAGVVKYVGDLPRVPEICFGVELDFPENGLRNGMFAGNYYFHWLSPPVIYGKWKTEDKMKRGLMTYIVIIAGLLQLHTLQASVPHQPQTTWHP